MDKYNELKAMVENCSADIEKFFVASGRSNKAAGTRVRKQMSEIKKKAQEIRIEVQEWKQADKDSQDEAIENAGRHKED
jgi:hypothetical protein